MADQPQRDVAVLADGAIIHVDLHQRRHLDALAVTHAEVEGRADDHHHVGLGEGKRAGAVEVMRIAWRQHAAAGAVHVAGNVEAAQKRDCLFMAARGVDLLAEQDGRTLGIHQDVGEPFDVGRIADRLHRGAVMAGLGDDGLVQRNLGIEDVARDFQIGRSVGAGEAFARRHRHHVGDAGGGKDAGGELGDGLHHVHMRQVLQRTHLVLGERGLAADMDDGAFRAEGGGNAGHRVGAAGAGRRHHAAELAGLAGIAVGGMGGGLLMAHVDDADAFVDAAVIDVDDVAAAQGEDGVDTLVLQRLGDQMATGYDAGVGALLGKRVGCGRGRHGR